MKKSKVAQELIIQCTPKKVFAKRMNVNFEEIPLGKSDTPATNQNCVYTSGLYTIKFKPGVPGMETKPFVMNIDFMPGNRLRIGRYSGLEKLADESPMIKWLLRNTTLTKEHFKIAMDHMDTAIPFSLDVVKIRENLKKNGETRKDFLWEVSE